MYIPNHTADIAKQCALECIGAYLSILKKIVWLIYRYQITLYYCDFMRFGAHCCIFEHVVLVFVIGQHSRFALILTFRSFPTEMATPFHTMQPSHAHISQLQDIYLYQHT